MVTKLYTKQLTVEGLDAQTVIDEFESIRKLIKQSQEDFQKNINKDVLLTREETADLLKISLPTLHDWTKKAILKAYRIGNRVRYKESEVIIALVPMNKYKSSYVK